MNAMYFLAGVISTLMFLSLMGDKKVKVLSPKKTWTKLSKIEYSVNFDHIFNNKINAQDVLLVINNLIEQKIHTQCKNFQKTDIEAGEYSVDAVTTVRFTHRS